MDYNEEIRSLMVKAYQLGVMCALGGCEVYEVFDIESQIEDHLKREGVL